MNHTNRISAPIAAPAYLGPDRKCPLSPPPYCCWPSRWSSCSQPMRGTVTPRPRTQNSIRTSTSNRRQPVNRLQQPQLRRRRQLLDQQLFQLPCMTVSAGALCMCRAACVRQDRSARSQSNVPVLFSLLLYCSLFLTVLNLCLSVSLNVCDACVPYVDMLVC